VIVGAAVTVAAVTENVTVLEYPRPSPFVTPTVMLPAFATDRVGTTAVSFVLEEMVVESLVEPKTTVDAVPKPVPLTVSVKPPEPATQVLGDNPEIVIGVAVSANAVVAVIMVKATMAQRDFPIRDTEVVSI